MADKESLRQVLERISKAQEVVVSQIKNMDRPEIVVIPSGSHAIDHALGVGGYPRGRIIEIFGKESGGKTTISLLAIAEAQKSGGVAAFIDVEHSLDLEWAKKLGVDVENLIFTQPESGEQALSVVEELVKSDQVDMIVVDSVAGLVPRSELEGELGQQQMAVQARMLSQGLRRLVGTVGKSKTVLIFINQVREGLNPYGEKEVTPGGKALKFYSSVRMSVKKESGSEIKDKDMVLGHNVTVSIKKSKVSPPFRQATFTLKFLEGVDRVAELVQLGLEFGLVKQAGPQFSYEKISEKGALAFLESFKADEAAQKSLWKAIKEHKK